MYATLLKTVLAQTLKTEGQKRIDKDKNTTGSDDASGKVFKAIGGAVDAVELDSVGPETFRNMAAAFRAAADELDRQADEIA